MNLPLSLKCTRASVHASGDTQINWLCTATVPAKSISRIAPNGGSRAMTAAGDRHAGRLVFRGAGALSASPRA